MRAIHGELVCVSHWPIASSDGLMLHAPSWLHSCPSSVVEFGRRYSGFWQWGVAPLRHPLWFRHGARWGEKPCR